MKKLIILLSILQLSLYNISFAQNPGNLDFTFGSGGAVTNLSSRGMDVAVQPDGKVITIGSIIIRYNEDGSVDNTFSSDGIDTLQIDSKIYNCNAIGIQPDGKILVGGGFDFYGDADSQNIVLFRYNPDGTRDNTFDGDGSLVTDFDLASEDYCYDLAIQPDGKIIVAGASNGKLALCCYNSDGSLDNTFNNDGKLLFNSIGVMNSLYEGHPAFLKLQPDGRILVSNRSWLLRLNPDGSFDANFSNNGLIQLTPKTMNDLAIQPDGKIVLAGTVGLADYAIMRLNANGSLDNSFGSGGETITHFDDLHDPRLVATSVALQSDGRILAGGHIAIGQLWNFKDFILIRYNDDGSLDSSFNFQGQVNFPIGYDVESEASAITPDFKIILAGHNMGAGPMGGLGVLARYHLGWLLDASNVSATNENFLVSPNPTFDLINIEASNIENDTWHLELRDVTGRLMLEEDLTAANRSIQKKISLGRLSAGIYFLQLNNDKDKVLSRVVKY